MDIASRIAFEQPTPKHIVVVMSDVIKAYLYTFPEERADQDAQRCFEDATIQFQRLAASSQESGICEDVGNQVGSIASFCELVGALAIVFGSCSGEEATRPSTTRARSARRLIFGIAKATSLPGCAMQRYSMAHCHMHNCCGNVAHWFELLSTSSDTLDCLLYTSPSPRD